MDILDKEIQNKIDYHGFYIGDMDGYRIFLTSFNGFLFYGLEAEYNDKIVAWLKFRPDGKYLRLNNYFCLPEYENKKHIARLFYFIVNKDKRSISIRDLYEPSYELIARLHKTKRFRIFWQNKTDSNDLIDFNKSTKFNYDYYDIIIKNNPSCTFDRYDNSLPGEGDKPRPFYLIFERIED